MFGKNVSIPSLLFHILLFFVVEIVFVLIVFREFPTVNLYSKIGIAHLAYRGVVLFCSIRREKEKKVMMRFIALWTPIIFHLLIHIRIGVETVAEHMHGHEHHEGELLRLVLGTLIAGFIIYQGEKLMHKIHHCETHHASIHGTCIENHCSDCEDAHS